MEWTDKAAVITGGSAGIGLALAKRLAAQGCDVAIASRSADKLERAAAELRRTSRGKILAVPCDVASRSEVRDLAQRASDAFGKIDLVCANAGATTFGPLIDHDDQDWDWSLDINLRGATNCVQAFLPGMVAQGSGALLITGSQTALAPDWYVNHGPYVAAKAALLALVIGLRAEVAGTGVQVSYLLPAGTQTDIAAHGRLVKTEGGGLRPGRPVPSPDPRFPMMLTPDEVAERALAGLRKDAPIIATHAAMLPIVEDYFAGIVEAYKEAARFKPAEAG